jgi:tetratricopeptide (TPR) repeat protein
MLNKKIIVITVFFIIAFLIYLSSINASFILDDFRNIVKNPAVRISELTPGTLLEAAGTDVNAGFRPIAYVSFALNHYFGGEGSTSYHVVNIIIHALNAFLIYLIILTLFDYDAADDEKKGKLALSAFFTALIWLVTPINSQTVIYVVQRMTLLMTLFFLPAFLFYVKGRKLKRTKYFVFSGVFFLLSFLSKQNAVIFPLVIILYELVFERGGELKNVTKNEKIIFILLAVILLIPLMIFWDRIYELFMKGGYAWDFTYYERSLTQFRILIFYLSLMILPLPGRLCLVHDIEKSTSLFSPVTTIFSIILILGLFAVAVLRIKKSPYFSFALLWFFITISVEAILPIEMMYEHRVYMPGIFLVGAAVSYVTDRFYGKNRQVLISVFCVVIIILGGLTSVRGKAWESELSIWNDVLIKYPNNFLALNNAAKVQILLEDYDSAEKRLRKALKVKEDTYYIRYAYNNLGYLYFKKKDYNRSIEMYKKIFEHGIRDDFDSFETLLDFGNALFAVGDYKNTIVTLNKALEIGLKYEAAYINIGNIHYNLGITYVQLKKYKEALTSFRKAMKYLPNDDRIKKNIKSIEALLNG